MSVHSGAALIDRSQDSPATFATRWLPPSTAVISAHGEIDAATAPAFTEYAMRHTLLADRLVLDLARVDFFGTAGFAALKALEVRCGAEDVDWMLVPSKAVTRLLGICDPDATLRHCSTVGAALSTLRGETPSLQLVTKPR